jgi:hypothetical protein
MRYRPSLRAGIETHTIVNANTTAMSTATNRLRGFRLDSIGRFMDAKQS